MQWLYLHFHSLQIESSLQFERTSEQAPLIIVDGHRHRVVQVNLAAKSLGITVDMGLATALSYSESNKTHPSSASTRLNIKEYKPDLEQERLIEIANRLYRLTADISIDPPQGLFLRIDNMLKLYKDIHDYWRAVTRELADLALSINYANAPTPFMAKALALSKSNTLFDSSQAARDTLSLRPIEALEITNKQKDQLTRVGLKQIKDLLVISLKDLSKRFDLSMFTYLGQLTGDLQTKLPLFVPKLEYRRTLELMFEITNAEVLKHPITKLLTELEQYLQRRNLVTCQLHFELCYRYQEFVSMTVERGDGEYRATKWKELIVLKLESVKLSEPVVSIRLYCEHLIPYQARMVDMFNTHQSALDDQSLLALLNAKLGHERVCSIQYINSVEPAKATAIKSTVKTHTDKSRDKGEQGYTKHNDVSVSCVRDIRPSYLQATPSRLKEHVFLLQGPERIMTGWWDFSPICRDYFVAENASGQKVWVYRTPRQQWYVHGYFS